VEQVNQPAHWGHDIVLAIAPTKNLDRIEWVVEKATEMGIDRIVPLLCCNSERKVLKTERLHKIAVAAMKQSLKATLPVIDELTPFGRFITQPFEGNRFIAYCDPMLPRSERQLFARQYVPHAHSLVLIGPEGDFSPEEVQQALAAGFIPVSLGESRLRTETAAIMAVASCHVLDMSNPKL
jgi:16S rRNA (uracil1498-N3)-methyltransferase